MCVCVAKYTSASVFGPKHRGLWQNAFELSKVLELSERLNVTLSSLASSRVEPTLAVGKLVTVKRACQSSEANFAPPDEIKQTPENATRTHEQQLGSAQLDATLYYAARRAN